MFVPTPEPGEPFSICIAAKNATQSRPIFVKVMVDGQDWTFNSILYSSKPLVLEGWRFERAPLATLCQLAAASVSSQSMSPEDIKKKTLVDVDALAKSLGDEPVSHKGNIIVSFFHAEKLRRPEEVHELHEWKVRPRTALRPLSAVGPTTAGQTTSPLMKTYKKKSEAPIARLVVNYRKQSWFAERQRPQQTVQQTVQQFVPPGVNEPIARRLRSCSTVLSPSDLDNRPISSRLRSRCAVK